MSLPSRDLTTKAGRTLTFTTLGFGTAPIGNMHRVMSDADAEATVASAWDRGGRYFDTAPLYGHGLAERRAGAVLRDKPRGAFLLSTKVGRLLEPCAPGEEASGIYEGVPPLKVRFDYSYDGVMRSFEESLTRLGLDRVDILYVHDIDAMTHGSREAAEGAAQPASCSRPQRHGAAHGQSCRREPESVAAIGAGVNEWEPCVRLMELADPDIFLLAGRYTLLEQHALISLLPACAAKGIGVVIGGPFNSGLLATGARPGAIYNYAPAPADILKRAAALEVVCARHGVRLAQAALQFPLGHPAVVCVIPGAQSAAEVQQNRDLLDAAIPDTLWADLKREGLMSLDAPAPVGT